MSNKREDLKSENLLLNILISKKWQLIRHIIMLFVLAVNFYPNLNPASFKILNIENPEAIITAINKASVLMFITSVVLIYANLFLLIPRLLLKSKYLFYFISCLVLAIAYFFSEYFFSNYLLISISKYIPPVELSVKGFVDSVFVPLVFLSGTAGYKIFKKWVIDTRLLAEMKESKIREELASLKNQINPHFLFNTLNNLNTLILTDPVKASSVVLGLSDVLRYQLYETNAGKVLLKKDIDTLRQFLELEKIRRDNFQFGIMVDGEITGAMIPPFIFTNFVENAIKHSTDNMGFSFVAIDFTLKTGTLIFTCTNSKPVTAVSGKTGGIGLQNIKRRLQLLYGDSYTLDITDNEKEFTVNLKLPL